MRETAEVAPARAFGKKALRSAAVDFSSAACALMCLVSSTTSLRSVVRGDEARACMSYESGRCVREAVQRSLVDAAHRVVDEERREQHRQRKDLNVVCLVLGVRPESLRGQMAISAHSATQRERPRRTSVSRSTTVKSLGTCGLALASTIHIQMPCVHGSTVEPMSKPAERPASLLRMYDLPVRYSPATVTMPTGPLMARSSSHASSLRLYVRALCLPDPLFSRRMNGIGAFMTTRPRSRTH